jgi:hypothetical protein
VNNNVAYSHKFLGSLKLLEFKCLNMDSSLGLLPKVDKVLFLPELGGSPSGSL